MDEILAAHQRIGVFCCYFSEIAQHVIMTYFQARNAGRLGIGLLQAGDDPARGVAQFAGFVELGPPIGRDESAIARQQGWLIEDSALQIANQGRQFRLVGEG